MASELLRLAAEMYFFLEAHGRRAEMNFFLEAHGRRPWRYRISQPMTSCEPSSQKLAILLGWSIVFQACAPLYTSCQMDHYWLARTRYVEVEESTTHFVVLVAHLAYSVCLLPWVWGFVVLGVPQSDVGLPSHSTSALGGKSPEDAERSYVE